MEKEVAKALQFAAESEKHEVISYFGPEDDKVTTPPAAIPFRSWRMNDETKRWVTVGHTPEEQASLLRQIANVEDEKKMRYFISVPTAFYEIEYGLVKGRGNNLCNLSLSLGFISVSRPRPHFFAGIRG